MLLGGCLLKVSSMAAAVSEKMRDRRNRVLLGPLPEDFLRINVSLQQQQEAADRQTAIALHHQLGAGHMFNHSLGRLNVTIVQAKLVKNYGMTRMDPYARMRIGHGVYETHTDPNGGKTPRWNKVIHCLIPHGINTITIEIFDERSFTMDELIAWTQITIPQQVLAGETHEEWYPLNGKQGDGVEGMINLVMSFTTMPGYKFVAPPPVVVVPNVGGSAVKPLKVFTEPPTAVIPPVPVLSESELKQIEEMFPNIDKEVIKTVFEANRGNKDGTINSLLQMAE